MQDKSAKKHAAFTVKQPFDPLISHLELIVTERTVNFLVRIGDRVLDMISFKFNILFICNV
jgi:hypothetical protein